jgi:hypothetical protein
MKGAILIYSCQKYKNTRLKEFTLSKREYDGWHVFIVLGDPFIDVDFKIEDNIITVKCEDSYFYVLKKVALGMRAVLRTFPIEEGILRCGDDLVFNEQSLQIFLQSPKSDYMGVTWGQCSTRGAYGKHHDSFMQDYYATHMDDFSNPLHGLPSPSILMSMTEIPSVLAASGVIIYFSNRACTSIIDHMEQVGWNILLYDETYGYPYTIEDNSIGYILSLSHIFPSDYPMYTDNLRVFEQNHSIALHTNKYK